MQPTRFLGIYFTIGNRDALLAWLAHTVYSTPLSTTVVIHANLNTVYNCTQHAALKAALNTTHTVIFFEGIALKLASLISRWTWWPDVNGTDLVPLYLGMYPERPLRLALVGGQSGVAEAAGHAITKRFPHLSIVKTLNGFDDLVDKQAALANILASHPDVLLLGLGTPLQEITAVNWAAASTISLIWSVGGLFDFWAGLRQRAPAWARICRLEWLWRFTCHPCLYWRRIFIQGPWLFKQVMLLWRN
jgi:exopolysaccharide biosynthesis WecB/TagA/CpsF family protein